MIEIGKYHELTILRLTSVGLYLGSDDSDEDILLPNKYCPEDFTIGDKINVFVYRDFAERKIATNIQPKILLHEFAFLRVAAVSDVGAFMDWGLEKDLLVPFKEQRQKMEPDRWYLIYMDLDEETDRLFGSNKLDKYLQNESLTVSVGDEIDIMIMRKTDIGYSVMINKVHKGLLFHNEIFKPIKIGDRLKGYVKQIREDQKIDVSLQPIGYRKYNDANIELIMNALIAKKGFLPLTDKSPPEVIYKSLGISKKAFKKSIGALYRDRKIEIKENGISLIE